MSTPRAINYPNFRKGIIPGQSLNLPPTFGGDSVISGYGNKATSAGRQSGLEEAFAVVRAITILGVVLGCHVLADVEVRGTLQDLAAMRRHLGIVV